MPRRATGRRPVFGDNEQFQHDPHWRDYVPFYEYFHGDNGAGVGASHQTGWTGLVAMLIQEQGEQRHGKKHGMMRGGMGSLLHGVRSMEESVVEAVKERLVKGEGTAGGDKEAESLP